MSLEFFPYLSRILERMTWSSQEIVKEIRGRPRLTIRIHLEGPTFPQRALEPIIGVGDTVADRVEVDEHGRWARGYFTSIPQGEHLIEFGFEDGVMFRFPEPFTSRSVKQLDRGRLADEIEVEFDWGPR